MKFWTDREDRIVAVRLDYPDVALSELQTALAAIGSRRTIKGIESRIAHIREQRAQREMASRQDEMTRLRAWWLAAPWRRETA
jgi:hypothetical protein